MVTTMLPAESTAAPKPPPAPFPWVTVALLAANVGVFGVELTNGLDLGGSANNATLLSSLGGNYVRHTLDGEWWRLATAMFLHGGPLALIMTVICVGQLRHAERIFGRLGFAAIYLVGGIAGGVATLTHTAPNVVSVGGAGGVFGLYGAYLAFLFVYKKQIDPVTWMSSLRSIGIFLGINLVYSLGAAHVDPSPFFVGLATGGLMGLAIVKGSPTVRGRIIRSAIALGAGLAVAAGVLVALPAPPPIAADYSKLGPTGALLEELIGLDRATNANLKATVAAGSRTLTDEQPRWLAFQAQVAVATIPDSQKALFAAINGHITAHIKVLADLAAMSRERGSVPKAAFDADLQADRAAVHQLAQETRALGL